MAKKQIIKIDNLFSDEKIQIYPKPHKKTKSFISEKLQKKIQKYYKVEVNNLL